MPALLVGPPEIYQKSAAAATTLIGPPEIYVKTSSAAATVAGDTSVDIIVSKFENAGINYKNALLKGLKPKEYPSPPTVPLKDLAENCSPTSTVPLMGLTENFSPTFLSTGNPCLDFFFHVVPDTPPETLMTYLKQAWDQDPLKALKLVCNLRGVKGTGKSDKEGFYTAALWLHDHHPKTLATNVAAIAEFGYFKDLLEILFRVLEGATARQLAKETGEKWKAWKSAKDEWVKLNKTLTEEKEMAAEQKKRRSYVYGYDCRRMNTTAALFRSRRGLKRKLIECAKSSGIGQSQTQTREAKRVERAKRVVERFNSDPKFTLLHEQVSSLFAQRLRSDMQMLKLGNLNKISLAAKWCPSLDSSFDRITLLCETIGKKVFPREEYPEYEGVEEAHYAYRVRDRLRKEFLVPLRKALELPEVYIGANDWGNLPYNRVASVAMKNYTGMFVKHDQERFQEYLDRVKRGEAKIAAGALLPHQIIAPFLQGLNIWTLTSSNEDEEEEEKKAAEAQVAELQWKRMVEDMSNIGELKNCLAISDVSGSMKGIPMEVSIALGILVSELSEEPWKGRVITFSEDPKLHMIEGESLKAKTKFVRDMDWGGSTDFQKVFDVLLQVAVNGKLKPEEMIKRLFVFSDMEFDQASMNPWETDYEAIVRKYREKGYGECVPEIVFWNLRDSRATPVPSDQAGVALVSGYSKNLMKIFLEKGGVMNPEAVMEAAIAGKEYEELVVID